MSRAKFTGCSAWAAAGQASNKARVVKRSSIELFIIRPWLEKGREKRQQCSGGRVQRRGVHCKTPGKGGQTRRIVRRKPLYAGPILFSCRFQHCAFATSTTARSSPVVTTCCTG